MCPVRTMNSWVWGIGTCGGEVRGKEGWKVVCSGGVSWRWLSMHILVCKGSKTGDQKTA